MGAVPEARADLDLAYTQEHPQHLNGRAGQHSDAPEACHDSGSRGTGCVHCARPGLWGGWLGNRWLYPEADGQNAGAFYPPLTASVRRMPILNNPKKEGSYGRPPRHDNHRQGDDP